MYEVLNNDFPVNLITLKGNKDGSALTHYAINLVEIII